MQKDPLLKMDQSLKKDLKTDAADVTGPLPGYEVFLTDLKERIRTARVKAALAVNRELVLLYWSIGRDILKQQQEQGWGSKVVEQLAKDLRREFPEMKGLSRTNLLYMRAFAEAWSDEAIVQQVAAQIPWGRYELKLVTYADPSLPSTPDAALT